MLLIAFAKDNQLASDRELWKISKIVMIFEYLDDLLDTASFETQRFQQHFINCIVANDREMPQIVVISLKEQRLLLNSSG